MKTDHIIVESDYPYSGYGDACLVKKVRQCSCGVWLFKHENELQHKIKVLWDERQELITSE